MLFNIAATISGEVVLREYSSDPGAPIATSARRKAMDDATVVRADAWSSVTLQRRTMEPALSGDTPPPARMMILPAAFSTSRESISAPSRAEGAWPEDAGASEGYYRFQSIEWVAAEVKRAVESYFHRACGGHEPAAGVNVHVALWGEGAYHHSVASVRRAQPHVVFHHLYFFGGIEKIAFARADEHVDVDAAYGHGTAYQASRWGDSSVGQG